MKNSHIKWGPPASGLVHDLDFEKGPIEALSLGLTNEMSRMTGNLSGRLK